jgi:hypothetical protein
MHIVEHKMSCVGLQSMFGRLVAPPTSFRQTITYVDISGNIRQLNMPFVLPFFNSKQWNVKASMISFVKELFLTQLQVLSGMMVWKSPY